MGTPQRPAELTTAILRACVTASWNIDALHNAWHYIDALALGQTKRADTRQTVLEADADNDAVAVIEALGTVAALAVAEAVRLDATVGGVDLSLAHVEVLRKIGRQVNG